MQSFCTYYQSRLVAGKGLASSAALEVAVMQAVVHAQGLQLDGLELAQLCQMAENLVAGAPCGIMDQVTASLGKANCLLALRCQPAELQPHITIPPGIQFWAIDSGREHRVSGSEYRTVRAAAFMGRRMLQDALPVCAPLDYCARLPALCLTC